MDKELEKSGHQKVLRRISNRLKAIGFERYKTNIFLRPKDKFTQFIHLHKFTFNSAYRIHLGIRVLNDSDDFFHLNGIDSSAYGTKDSPNGKRYNFRYHKTDETIERCVENIFQFCVEVGEKWFERWSDYEKLINSEDSPLNDEEKSLLKKTLI
jgi:hypothetical protein